MAKPQSVFLTAVIAMVLGIALGAVGIVALVPKLSPNAHDVSNTIEDKAPKPQVYGNR